MNKEDCKKISDHDTNFLVGLGVIFLAGLGVFWFGAIIHKTSNITGIVIAGAGILLVFYSVCAGLWRLIFGPRLPRKKRRLQV